MAKICRIEILRGAEERRGQENGIALSASTLIKAVLVDDITVEYKSSFRSFGELLPQITDIINLATTFQASTSGTVNANWLRTANIADIPRWEKTEPVRLTLKLVFYSKTDAKKDVWEAVKQLVSLSILTKEGNKYIVPGISLATMRNFTSAISSNDARNQFSNKSKLISLEIPGVVYLPIAMVESAVPTFSSEDTESQFPLWASVDLSVLSTHPATTEYLDITETIPRRIAI